MTESLPPILRAALVARPVDETFAIFIDEIGAWWPLPTHSVFQGQAGGVHFEDGRLVERSVDGRQSVWAEVIEWDPPKRLVLSWHPGTDTSDDPEAATRVPAGRVEVTFTAEGDETRVELRHDGWEAFGLAAGAKRRSYIGPSAWGHILDHLADGAERRADGDDSADLTALEAAYAAFFAEAEAGLGRFAAPTDGGWTAEQVVAHVALNDLAMTAVAHGLVHQQEPSFTNQTCQTIEVLDSVVTSAGTIEDLLVFGRRCSVQAIAAARQLDPEQRRRPVACRFEHDGELAMEQVMPWEQVAVEIQAAHHLPAHIEQLQKLKTD